MKRNNATRTAIHLEGWVPTNGYAVQNMAAALTPVDPEEEGRLCYQYYFHDARGRASLTKNSREPCRLFWSLWSPTWPFDDATYSELATAFDNPDFVEVVIHSYRHRFGLVAGTPNTKRWNDSWLLCPECSCPRLL
jgi:hypothetical protein